MREQYLEIIDQAVRAYSPEKITDYIARVEKEGIMEHGFPRLTANIGILLSHGRREELKDIFFHMMDLCCQQIPYIRNQNGKRVGNDFSVREICFALMEAEKSGLCSEEQSRNWRELLAAIQPYEVYSDLAEIPPKRIGNWAQFAATSEVVRMYAGIGAETDFIDAQIASQVLSFDENGFYRDPNEPMLYDLMTRLQMAMALHFGYQGKYRQEVYDNLMKASMPTLYMQSVNGELAYGGRSNQFLFNEAAIAAMCEFYAVEYKKLGQMDLASDFKRAAQFASESIMKWIQRDRVHHIKNCYPPDSTYGCEGYGYFDKYMVTLGSNIYCGYIMADDTIEAADRCIAEKGGYTYQTGDYFHKVFLNSGKAMAEIDYMADYHYDASGLGRIHFAGAPASLILSVPFMKDGHYTVDIENPYPLSMCGGMEENGRLILGSDPLTRYSILSHGTTDHGVYCDYEALLPNGKELKMRCELFDDKVILTVTGEGKICQILPVFDFDGQDHTEIEADEDCIRVRYKGFEGIFTTDGKMKNMNSLFANRNGHYQGWYASGEDRITVTIQMHTLK